MNNKTGNDSPPASVASMTVFVLYCRPPGCAAIIFITATRWARVNPAQSLAGMLAIFFVTPHELIFGSLTRRASSLILVGLPVNKINDDPTPFGG